MANIIFMGGEDIDFSPNPAGSFATGPGNAFFTPFYRPGYSRGALTGQWRVPQYYGLSVPTNSWFHAYASIGAFWQFTLNGPGDIARLALYGGGPFALPVLYKVDAAKNTTPLINFTTGLTGQIDINIVYSTTGSIAFYNNQDLVGTFSGDVTTDGNTSLVGFDLGGVQFPPLIGGGQWSEVIWSDSDTRAMSLVTLAPISNGNTDNWDVGGVSNINELTIDDTTFNASLAAGELQQYLTTDPPSLPNIGVISVGVSSRAVAGPTGPSHLMLDVRTHSTDYNQGNFAIPAGYVKSFTQWPTNPNTGVAWLYSELFQAAGFNIGIRSA